MTAKARIYSLMAFITIVIVWWFLMCSCDRAQGIAGTSDKWGRIANPMHQGERLFTALLFAGPPNPRSLPLYTHHPLNADKLDWSSDASIDYALDQMKSAGLNTIKLSYWGHDGEADAWAPALLFSQGRWSKDAGSGNYSEAEQVARARHFFERANAKAMLIAPMIEVSPKFPFYADFPNNADNLVGRAAWLLKNLGDEPNWLQVYDSHGAPRRVIWLIETIHGGAIDPNTFADGFGKAALAIQNQTGYGVGFIIDPTPLPPYGSDAGPDPDILKQHWSILAINPFNITSQGIAYHSNLKEITDDERQQYAESVLRRWAASGIPLIAPIMPGYDAHLVFPNLPVYGFTDPWRARQAQLAVQYGNDGVSIDCWNGWTEGYAIPPSAEDGNADFAWAQQTIKMARSK